MNASENKLEPRAEVAVHHLVVRAGICTLSIMLGMIAYPAIGGISNRILEANFRGFTGPLIEFLLFHGAVLGALTGFAFTMPSQSQNRTEHIALVGLCVLVIAWLLVLGIPFRAEAGNRIFISVYGIGIVWASLLACKGVSKL